MSNHDLDDEDMFEDFIPADCPNFDDGLTMFERERVKRARHLYLKNKSVQLQPQKQEQTNKQIESEWNGVLSLPEVKNTTFDFNVLQSLLSDKQDHFVNDNEALSLKKGTEEVKDDWRYDIGLDK